MPDDVIVAKAEIIERCIKRARDELAASTDFASDFTRQDASILNIERACDAAAARHVASAADVAGALIRSAQAVLRTAAAAPNGACFFATGDDITG